VEDRIEERPGGQHDASGSQGGPVGQHDALDGRPPQDQPPDLPGDHPDLGRPGHEFRNGAIVVTAVALEPRGLDGRSLLGIEDPTVDPGGIGGTAHQAPQGIDLPDQVALADAADGGIAGHPAQGGGVLCHQDHLAPQACRGQGRLHARVTTTDDQHLGVHLRSPPGGAEDIM